MVTCIILVNAFIFGRPPGRREINLFTDGGPKLRDIKEGVACLKQHKCRHPQASTDLTSYSVWCGDMQLWWLVLAGTRLAVLRLGYFWTLTLSRACWKRTRCHGAVAAPSPPWTQTCPLWLAQDYTQGSCARKRAEPEFVGKHRITFLPIKTALTLNQTLEIFLSLK